MYVSQFRDYVLETAKYHEYLRQITKPYVSPVITNR